MSKVTYTHKKTNKNPRNIGKRWEITQTLKAFIVIAFHISRPCDFSSFSLHIPLNNGNIIRLLYDLGNKSDIKWWEKCAYMFKGDSSDVMCIRIYWFEWHWHWHCALGSQEWFRFQKFIINANSTKCGSELRLIWACWTLLAPFEHFWALRVVPDKDPLNTPIRWHVHANSVPYTFVRNRNYHITAKKNPYKV